ncbi:T9SS type A sorting domain-containing protein [Haliscomenobacter sp.]|uniref:T9SS type A sorting domain-containing protein n=1 Tax=Haliscomenobacter sp. TaxID=2717303 RepID=UPI003593D5FB
MNIKIGLKWILLLLLFWTSPLLCQGQDTLHLDFSDTTIYRGTDWNKRFEVTLSARTPYPTTAQFSIQWFAWGPSTFSEARPFYFRLAQIIPLDTPTIDLSHFGTRQIGEGFLRVITHINPAQPNVPKALFKLVFEAENPEVLEKELDRWLIDLPIQQIVLANTPIEIVAVGDSLQQLAIRSHGGQIMLRTAVWPGDVDNNGQVDQYDMLALGLEIGQSTTKPRPNASIEWTPQTFVSQSSNQDAVLRPYWDTDGNALIDLNDTLAIHQNWGKTVPNRKIRTRPQVDSFALPLMLNMDTLSNRREIELPIVLGSAEAPARNAYGLAFSLNYGPGIGKMARISADFSRSFFRRDKRPLLTYVRNDTAQNKLHLVISRLQRRAITGYGEIARVKLTVEDLIFIEPFLKNLNIDPQSIVLIDRNNKPIPVAPGSEEIRVISDVEHLINNAVIDQKVKIYPTPCSDVLHVQSDQLSIENLKIFSQDGKLIQQFSTFTQKQIDTSRWPSGTYQLQIETGEGTGVKKILVQH